MKDFIARFKVAGPFGVSGFDTDDTDAVQVIKKKASVCLGGEFEIIDFSEYHGFIDNQADYVEAEQAQSVFFDVVVRHTGTIPKSNFSSDRFLIRDLALAVLTDPMCAISAKWEEGGAEFVIFEKIASDSNKPVFLYDCFTLIAPGDFSIHESMHDSDAMEKIMKAINHPHAYIVARTEHTNDQDLDVLEFPLNIPKAGATVIDLNSYSGVIIGEAAPVYIDGKYEGTAESIPEIEAVRKVYNSGAEFTILEKIETDEIEGTTVNRISLFYLGE